jgi:hypothetical protein
MAHEHVALASAAQPLQAAEQRLQFACNLNTTALWYPNWGSLAINNCIALVLTTIATTGANKARQHVVTFMSVVAAYLAAALAVSLSAPSSLHPGHQCTQTELP